MKTRCRFDSKTLIGYLTYAGVVAGIALVPYLLSSPAAALQVGSPCVKTAQDLSMSCTFGVSDDYFLSQATCDNLSNGEEQKACMEQAFMRVRQKMAPNTMRSR
jgi:hypothetical protein